MREERVKVYVAEDGTRFFDKAKCEEYERNSIHTVEVVARISAAIRLDGVKVKLPVNFYGDLKGLSDAEILTQFLDRAWLEFTSTDNSLPADELLKIAEEQGISPYLDCYEDVDIYDYRVLEG